MSEQQLSFANLTESELQKIKETETFLNGQPDHAGDMQEGREIILLAYSYSKQRV